MRYLITFCALTIFFLASCGPSAEEKAAMEKCMQDEIALEKSIRENLIHTFDAPFPRRNRNLTRILGDTLQVASRCGGWWNPLTYKIRSTKYFNTITNINTGEILFTGTVCKFRDLYYFSERLNDTSYRIFALRINDSLIYGLQNYFQYSKIDSAMNNGYYPKLLMFKDNNGKQLRLHPDKRELRKLYTSILDNTEPFERINININPKINDIEDITTPIEPGDFDLFSKIYPNPATDIINIELSQKSKSTYQLTDLGGKTVLIGELDDIVNKIDISNQKAGIYALTIVNVADKRKETTKIVKTK